jgi:RNA 2',3'-cyclic 3'-phosphodiesterase
MRLFAALKISNCLAEQISKLPRKGLESARFSHPDDLHITLRFMGEVDEKQLPEIQEILEGVRVKQFTVVVRGLNIFEKKNQTILYAPVESAKSATHLSAEITERLQKSGFVFSDQLYKPHVTIARLRNITGINDYIRKNERQIFAEWRAEEFILYKSAEPDDGGKRYAKLQKYNLSVY